MVRLLQPPPVAAAAAILVGAARGLGGRVEEHCTSSGQPLSRRKDRGGHQEEVALLRGAGQPQLRAGGGAGPMNLRALRGAL